MSPVLLAPQAGRSRHVCAAANGPSRPLRLRARHRRPQPHLDRAVSHGHSLPQGTGTFPAASLGASSPSVRCEAVLPLPPTTQGHHWTINCCEHVAGHLAINRNETVHLRTSKQAYDGASLTERNKRMTTGLQACASCQQAAEDERSACGGMGRVSPVLLAPLAGRSRHVCAAANVPKPATAAPREASPPAT